MTVRVPGRPRRRNWRVGLVLAGVVVAMNGFAYASVPAYREFCQQFGFAGIPLTADTTAAAEVDVLDRTITVRFNADVDPDLPWRFKPGQRQLTLRIGQTGLAYYNAQNRGRQALTGTATFNVTPLKAAPYFVKVACFCFTEQTLGAGEAADMPVTFFVDPEIARDRNLDDVGTITLSYTFFGRPAAAAEAAQAAGGPANPVN